MKIFLLVILILFISGCYNPERDACNKNGGQWRGFSDSSADKCDQSIGADVIIQSCDCGPDECWDGVTCVPNK